MVEKSIFWSYSRLFYHKQFFGENLLIVDTVLAHHAARKTMVLGQPPDMIDIVKRKKGSIPLAKEVFYGYFPVHGKK